MSTHKRTLPDAKDKICATTKYCKEEETGAEEKQQSSLDEKMI